MSRAKPLTIRQGAASMSYDLVRKGRTVATVWSGDQPPSDIAAMANAKLLAHAETMRDLLSDIEARGLPDRYKQDVETANAVRKVLTALRR